LVRINLKNAKAPNGLLIPITVNIEHSVLVENQDGELIFLLTFETGAIDVNGNRIDTVVIDGVTQESIKKEIQKGVTIIGDQIDWENLQEDTTAPKIEEISPEPDSEAVDINSHVVLKVKDSFPTTGIDPESIKLLVNNVDVTDDLKIDGADTEYYVRWIPTILK
jgi:hypothetical protein